MPELARVHTDRLKELKQNVEEAHKANVENIRRFEKFVKFVFKTSLGDDEAATLASIGKPTIEFNILESFISRKRGEFAKQQPGISVRAADGIPLTMLTREFTETIDIMEAHLRCIFFDGANDMLDYNVYSKLLAGGWDVLRVYTKYVNEMSFEQNICVEEVFDPTLTFFDPLARDSHKGDGRYCGELYPMSKNQFETEFGEDMASQMKFSKSIAGFDWSYLNGEEKVVLVCDYYEKKSKKVTIVKLSNGHTIIKDEYKKLIAHYEENGIIEQPPIILEERKSKTEYICRYRICENQVLDYVETDYKYLPLVFVDGNSVVIKESGTYTQMTRPYVYHAEGIQRLKNLAGQSLGNELENTIQHKFIVALESIPEDYQEAYQNVQKADTLVYNYFLDTKNPTVTLPAPREVTRTPVPPEITNTFRMSDEMTQTILGSYDPSQGINQANMSGVAFARSTIQGDNASVPYIVGYIKGLNRVAQMIVDLIPKYYRTPRSLPILLPDGKRSFVEINKQGSLYMNYDPNSLQVKVEVGVNFSMQKEIALQTIISLSQANQGFAQFFNEVGLPTLLDNIEIRGIDDLKEKAQEWMKKQQMMQQQAQQMQMKQQQMQGQVQQMEMAKMQKDLQDPSKGQIEIMKMQQENQIESANLDLKQRDSDSKFLQVMSQIRDSDIQAQLKASEVDAENTRSAVEAAVKLGTHINESLERNVIHGQQA